MWHNVLLEFQVPKDLGLMRKMSFQRREIFIQQVMYSTSNALKDTCFYTKLCIHLQSLLFSRFSSNWTIFFNVGFIVRNELNQAVTLWPLTEITDMESNNKSKVYQFWICLLLSIGLAKSNKLFNQIWFDFALLLRFLCCIPIGEVPVLGECE